MDVGNYRLLHVLGRGGTGEVYAAKHRERGDTVAVKLVKATADVDVAVEAMRVRDIHHPNVVRVLEAGRDYLVMEMIEGETLAARLKRGPIGELELRELGAAIADGMQAAHARGIVHRDLKPGNVMMRGDSPVIVDFGIAKSLGATTAAVTERRVGTVAYMAPEQLVDGLITPAVDIWALGVTLYEAATGELPFKSFVDGRLPQLFEAAPRITTTSPAFADHVARCLERDPGRRPTSMADIARALRSDDADRVTADMGSTLGVRSSNVDGLGSTTSGPPSNDDVIGSTPTGAKLARKRWALAAVAIGTIAAATATVIVLREPKTTPPATTSPAAAVTPVEVESPVVDKPVVDKPVVDKPVVDKPVVDQSAVDRPSKRTKPRPKPRTTSQGETLD